jgi:uncharacterized 2Fe-2S/4Fe-4S cluster protein (DUF4445 family)
LDVYGNTTFKIPQDDSEAGGGAKLTVKSNAHLTLEADFIFGTNTAMAIESDGKLTIAAGAALDNGGEVINHGTINIYGTVSNLDDIINYGTINNYSENTLDNRGTLTNNGLINNTGTITNEGTIDNTQGTIKNEGTFKSVQSEGEMGGKIEGDVQQINGTSSSSGGGCNAGYGLLGLLLAGLVTRRYRKV